MIEQLLISPEGKTIEFKESARSLDNIVRTVIAFANTAGGTLIIGVEDKAKKLVGVDNPIEDETRIANAIAESITPLITPSIEIHTYRKKTLLIITVSYAPRPYRLKHESEEKGIYIRFGSTNRLADPETIETLKRLAKNSTFDELRCARATQEDIDWNSIEHDFKRIGKKISKETAKGLGIFVPETKQLTPSNGGVLLYGMNRKQIFSDAVIKCVRFLGESRSSNVLDSIIVNAPLPDAVNDALHFIAKNTLTKTTIGRVQRADIPQYPAVALREAVINAIVHTDYSIKGGSITVMIFNDRIEIQNPGCLPPGLTLEEAITGSSRIRNRVIAKTFHHLRLIESWGSGVKKIIELCADNGLKKPLFEEMLTQFKVTIYATQVAKKIMKEWERDFLEHVKTVGGVTTQEAADFLKLEPRTTRYRLKKLVDDGFLAFVRISPTDPHGKYIVRSTNQ